MRMVLVGVALAAALSACARVEETEGAALAARGEYLVTSIGGCNDCHTPMTPHGPDMSRSLQGADLVFGPRINMAWAPHAPTLAGLPAGYTRAQLEHFLQTGERPNGSHATPPMPQFRMNEDDARAVAAYIETLPKAE